jgi:hypothetical protein
MMANLVGGLVGIGLLVIFLGILLVWVPAPPLIIIVLIVLSLLIYDWVRTLRTGNGNTR